MIALAAELADGVLPAGLPPAFTAQAAGDARAGQAGGRRDAGDHRHRRPRSGAGAGEERGRASLSRSWYAATIARLGYPPEQIAAVSDELVSEIVAHGDPGSIAAAAAAHLAAGADHVILMSSSSASNADLVTSVAQLEQLAPAVLQSR